MRTPSLAQTFSELPRYNPQTNPSVLPAPSAPVMQLPDLQDTPLTNTEVYIFKDTAYYQSLYSTDKEGLRFFDSTKLLPLQNAAILFDRVIYPKFLGIFPKGKLISPTPKMTLIIDDRSEIDPHSIHRGFVSREYFLKNGIYGMVLDGTLLDAEGFSVVAAHELQHVFNYIYSLQTANQSPTHAPAQFQVDWLNEGLSEFMEYYISGMMPQTALADYATLGKTRSIETWPNDAQVTENDYTGALLWVTYLYYHFGKEELLWRLITDPRQGMDSVMGNIQALSGSAFNLDAKLITPRSIQANFDLALGINSKSTGIDGLLSLTGDDFIGDLTNFKMVPDLFVPQTLQNQSLSSVIPIEPHQSSYLRLTPDFAHASNCLSLTADPGVYAYEIDSVPGLTQIQPLKQHYCPNSDAIWNHLIVIVNENDQIALPVLAIDPPLATQAQSSR